MKLLINTEGNDIVVTHTFYKDGKEVGFYNKFGRDTSVNFMVSKMKTDAKWLLENVNPIDFTKRYTSGAD